MIACRASRGFTLIELLAALLLLSLLSLLSYRGLTATLDAREHVQRETDKWRGLAAFFARFEHDVQLAAPRAARTAVGPAPPWLGEKRSAADTVLEFSRFAGAEGYDAVQRVAYRLGDNHVVELLLWPGADMAPASRPARHVVLSGVSTFELQYLTPGLSWADSWPGPGSAVAALPRAVRVRLVLTSGEEIVRVFALNS